ncbi:uncharacterized protein LOC132707454 [Cylas formicarius]|uniref:uncharacterized protein LOC132707454 n=1 Tax=Cylas formicarius TaxID=197179 RepID=UPI0029588744|nr:uncharacterized protein LOC132707454 [Cylas formicarius]
MRNEFSATSPSREKDLMTPSVRKDIEKIPHQIIDRLPEGIRKDITTPPPSMRKIASSEFAADEQPKLWTSTPKRSMNDISEAVIVEPSIPTEEKEIRKLELAKTGEEKQVPKLQREVAKPTEVLKDIQFTKPRSMEVQETQETLEPIIEAQIEFKETSSPKHLSKAKETGALEETQPSQLSKQLFEEERAGSLPFSVTNEIQVLEEPPSGLHMTTTITGSGTLEVTTEGPAGTIETTLTYTEDGNVEVVTEMVQFADSTKSPISLPLESLLSTHPEVADPETKLKPIVPIISSLISGPSAQDTPFSSSELTSELTSQITSGMEEVIPIVKDSKEMISPPRDLEPETIASLQLVTTEEVPSSVLSEKEGSNGPIRTDSFKISGDELVESPKEMKEKVGSKEPISSDSLRISEDDKVDSPSEKGIIKPTIETVIRDEMLEFGAPVSTELDVTASNKVADKKVTLDVEDQVFEVRKHAAPDAPTVAPEAEETSKPTVKSHGVDCGCQSKDEKEQSCQCCECKEIGITTSGDKETITETDEMCKMVEETGEKDDSDSDFMTLSETNEIAEDQDFGKKTGDTVEEISNLPSDQAETQHKTDPILIAKYPEFVGKTAEEQRSVLIALGYEQPLIDRMMSQPSKESPKLTGETVAKDSVGPVLTEKIIAQDEIPKEEPARKQELPHVSAAEMAFVYDRPKSIEVPEEQGMIVATSQHPVPGVQQLQDFGNVEDKVVLPISQDPLEFVTGWYKPEKALAAKPGVHGKMVEEQNVEREMVAQQIPVELAIQPTKLTPPQQLEAKIRPVTSYPPEQLHRSKERATPSAEQYIKIDELPISTSQEPRDSPPAKASLRADDDFVEKIISIVDESSFLVEEPQKVRSTSDSCKAICSSIRTSAAAMSLNQSRSVSLQEKPSSREGSASCKASCRTISVQSSKTKTKDIAMSPVVPAKNSSPDGNPEEVRYKKKSNEVPSIVSQLSDKGLNPTLTGQAIKKSKPQRKKRNSSSKVLKKIECDCGDVCQCIICAPKVIEKRNAALRRRSFSCECPPQVIVVPQVMQMTCSMKTSRSAGHSQGCTCEDCRCSPCSPCPNVDKAASECRAECSEKSGSRKTDGKSKRGKSKTTIDDVFMSCKFPEMTPQTCDYQKSYAHAQDCECVDCLTLPKVKELAMTREYPIVFDEKQVYQVKVNCECVNATNAKRYVEQQRSRIPISITSPHPPRARSDHTQKLEAQTIEPKSSASEGTYKSACECQPCKCASCADPDVKKPVTPLDTQRKTCFCIGVCTCKVCPETKRAAATEVDATTAVPAPVRHTEDVKPVASSTEVDPDCDCPTCPCPFSKESRPDQHLTTHAPPAGDDCDCPLCDCPGLQKPIEEKPTVLPPMHVDVDKVPPTHVDLDKGGHPPDCNCPTCTCPGLKEISPVSDCDCPMCDCPGSPLKQPKVTEKMSERKDVVPTKPEDCTCTVCGCGDGAEVPRHHAKLLKEEGGLASCDCPSCQCVPCPDPGKERTGVPPPTAESIKPVDSCDCKECHCKPCADPKKAAKVETVAPHQRDLLEVPKKIPHPPDCECRECMCLEEIIQTELVVTLETGTQPATQPDVHAADCACPQCLCVECATKHSHPAGCRCDQCICSICDHKDKPAESFPVARHHGECSCIECRCDVCDRIQEIGLAKPSARIVHHEGCNCAECLCKECDTQLKSQLSCQCVHCLCKECLSKVKQYVRPLSQQSQRIKSTHPDGCKCLLCLCRECDEGERRALADECQCGKCICISCPKRKIGVAYAATKKELPAQVPSQLRTEPTPRAYGVKGPGCTCEQCICVECQGLMFATEKTAAPPPATISSTVSRPEDCDCQVCNCPEAKTAAPRRVTPTISKKVSHPQDCDCLVCTCTGEIGRPATPAISRMVSHPEREIIIDRPVTPKISSKISHPKDCICRVCQCPEELASRPVTPTTSRRVSHPKDCNCVVCRCPARPVTPTVSSRVPHPKGCDCLICNCLEEEEEEYISARPGTPTISKIVSHTAKDIISRPVTPKISSKVAHAKDCECPQCKHSPDCVCPGCLSLEEEIKSQRKTSSSFESAHGEDCTCPECTCEDLAAEMQIPSAAPLKRKKEEYLSAKSSEVAKPLLVLTDPPPFEAFPVPDCDCGKCDCSMCSRKAGIRKLPSSDKAKPTFTLTGPPPFEEFAEPDCKCKTCECLECTRKPGYIRLPRVPKTTEAERDVDQTARSPCDCQRCDCEVCSKTTQQLGREPKQIAAQVSSSKMSRPQTPIHCDCPTCTCDEGVLSKVEAESKTLSTISKQPSKEFFSTTSHPTETDTPRKDKAQHPADCDCPECGPCPDLFTHIPAQSSFQVPEIRKMDSVTLKQQIQAHTKENCECREEIEEIKKALNQIRCACTEAEMRTARTMMGSKPFVKQASVFGQTMSGLKMALNNLQDKCKAKDKMIAAMAGELQLRGNEEVIDKVLIMSQQMCQALDYDQAEDVKSLDRSQLVADIIYPSSDIRDQATEPCVESKSVEVRTHKRKKKLSKKVSCICSTPQIIQRDEKDCKKVDLTKFEVVDVKRITGDSLIIKWVAPGDKTITGYDIYINGTLLSKVMSGARTSAMVHSLDLSKNVHISIYAVTKCGRCDRPAIAIYKIKP